MVAVLITIILLDHVPIFEIIIYYFDFKIIITKLQSNTLSSLSSSRVTLWLITVLNKA